MTRRPLALLLLLGSLGETFAQGLPFVTQRTPANATTSSVFFRPQPARTAAPARPQAAAPRAPTVAPDPVAEAARKAETAAKVLEFQLKRAEEGAPSAQYDLALRYLKGDGVAQDETEARKWLTAAAKSGNDRAIAKLKELDPQ